MAEHCPACEDAELLDDWVTGPGARPTEADRKRWWRFTHKHGDSRCTDGDDG